MKIGKALVCGIIVVFVLFFLPGCVSTSNSQASGQNREEALKKAVSDDPNNPAKYGDLAVFYRTQGKYVLAAGVYEKMAELDPAYRLSDSSTYSYTPSTAAFFGVQTDKRIEFNNISVFFMLAAMYFDMANGSGTDPEKVVPQTERQNTFEKALAAFRRGYEIDITRGANNDKNLQIAYLMIIGLTLDKLGRTDEANSTYTELAKIANVTDPIARRIGSAVAGTSTGPQSSEKWGITGTIRTYNFNGRNLTNQVGTCYVVQYNDDSLYVVLLKPGFSSLGTNNQNTYARYALNDASSLFDGALYMFYEVILDGRYMEHFTGDMHFETGVLIINIWDNSPDTNGGKKVGEIIIRLRQ